MSAVAVERPPLHERLRARPPLGMERRAAYLAQAAAEGFAALRDAEPDLIAEAEREAIQAEPTLESCRQRIPHEAMVAGLLASAQRDA